jgi:hypothetical protein
MLNYSTRCPLVPSILPEFYGWIGRGGSSRNSVAAVSFLSFKEKDLITFQISRNCSIKCWEHIWCRRQPSCCDVGTYYSGNIE